MKRAAGFCFRYGIAAVLACGTSHTAIAAESPAQSVNVHKAAATITGKQDVAAPVGKAKPGGRATARRQPNIVFILLDDVRYDDIIDHPFAQLPNLARLRAEGTSFTRMFTSAPLCSPSRAAFLTGQYPLHNGIVDNGERAEQSHKIVTFPRLLHDAGYRTGFFGKWHMGHDDDTARPGFDRWVSFLGQGVYFDPLMNIDGARVQAKGYMTDLLTDEAISFIKKTPADRPFLAFISQKASHPEIYPNQVRTFPPAPGDEKLYEDAVLPRSPSWRVPVQGKPALARPVDANDPRSPAGGLPDAVIKDRLRMLSAVDRSVGKLLEALSAEGILDETIFIVTSDQGFFYGEFGLAQERRLAYEPSIRIPFIMRYPSLSAPGAISTTLASNVDVAPTLLQLASAAQPANMDGRSLVPSLQSPGTEIRKDLLIEYYSDTEFPRVAGMGYKAIRTERFKYIRYDELRGMDELYDIISDPHELNNLLPGKVPAHVISDLERRLDALIASKSAELGNSLNAQPDPVPQNVSGLDERNLARSKLF